MARLKTAEAQEASRRRPHTLVVSIAHGDLKLAKYPLAVGHYHGDTIVHAERRLDQQLGGRLTELFNLYLYPGPKETAAVIHDPGAQPPGALVIGLGDVGDLRPATVREGVANAALRHALAVLEEARVRAARERRPLEGPITTGISTLLLGTYGGNALSIEASLTAIIQGVVQANEALSSVRGDDGRRRTRAGGERRTVPLWELVRISEVQVIELYEDVAVSAARGAAYLSKNPPADFPEGDTLQFEPLYLNPLGYGRFQRPIDPYAGGGWRRIRVTEEKGEDGRERGLSFLALTDRARAEDTLQYTQSGFIKELVRRAINSEANAQELATVLFKLLMPNSIKDQARAEADLLLILDAASAQYPWELLAERSRDNKIEPIALRMGLIRQFQTRDYVQNPQPARGLNALVVGEPKSGQVPLPGAQAEARAVAKLLSDYGYSVGDRQRGEEPDQPLIKPDAIQLLNRLFEKGYKILHLAGHGEYVPGNPSESGMILDTGVLSSITLRNLSPLPELVFINCCHLGRLDAPKLHTTEPHALAASISEELIKMGVKAVVAAGWAVEDRAAARFATVFYQQMLDGRKFGEAVKAARRAAYDETPSSNTWGAYQCYGNPDFVLSAEGDGSESARPYDDRCYTRSEYIERFADIASNASRADGSYAERLARELTSLAVGIPAKWQDDGEVLGALARAWSGLRRYDKAVEWYAKANKDPRGGASLRSVEQLASNRIKLAQGTGEPARAADLLDQADKDLEWLLAFGETSERLSLLASSRKRRAAVAQAPAEKRKLLREAKEFYGRADAAHRRARNNEIDPYPVLNWLTYRLLLGEELGDEDFQLLERCKAGARDGGPREPEFWHRVHAADARLVESLARGELEQNVDELIDLYQRAFDSGCTPYERAGVTDHFDYLRSMLAALGKRGDRKQSDLRALDRLRVYFTP